MPKGSIKAKVIMEFHSFYDPREDDPPALLLSGEDKELKIGVHSGLKLDGTVTLEKLEMHDLLKEEIEKGREPLFRMRIV